MEHTQKQEIIDAAIAKGFITIDEESIDYNYKMALEFEKLIPEQQNALAHATH